MPRFGLQPAISASVEEAVRQLIDDRIAEIANDEDGEHDDVASAKPYVD